MTILGISASGRENGITSEIVSAVLEATGEPYDLVKLAGLHIGGCHGCTRCAADNRCKVMDDWPVIGEKMLTAEAIVFGAPNYYGMINVVDDAIGRIRAVLEGKGILDNTIIVYFSDHGEMMFDHGLLGKSVFFDGSVKVPCIIRYPLALRQGLRSEANASTIDLVPTLLEMAGAEPLKYMNGTSMLPLLTGEAESYREATFSELGSPFNASGSQTAGGNAWKMVREGRWKYVYSPAWDRQILFDLETDPDELNNLSGSREYAETEKRLHDMILDWIYNTEYAPR